MELLEEQRYLLKQFAAGDASAFETLFRQFQGPVYGWIVRIVRDEGIAEDLTVETFWRIHRARERFDATRSFGAWARRIATNVAFDHLKSVRREIALPEDMAVMPVDPGVGQEIRERAKIALRRLPAKYQAVAVLALIEECPYEEISEALGISVGAIKSRVFRAVRMLRKELKELGNFDRDS